MLTKGVQPFIAATWFIFANCHAYIVEAPR
jgi:hypothetical protein